MGVECGGCAPHTIANCCCQLFRQCTSILTPAVAFCLLGQRSALEINFSARWPFLVTHSKNNFNYANLCAVNSWCLENSEPPRACAATDRKSGHALDAHIVGFLIRSGAHWFPVRILRMCNTDFCAHINGELPLYPFKITQSREMLNTSGRWRCIVIAKQLYA